MKRQKSDTSSKIVITYTFVYTERSKVFAKDIFSPYLPYHTKLKL